MQTQPKRLIVDLSSILWTCLLVGIDKEFGKQVEFNGKKVQINSATYGFENAVNHFVGILGLTDLAPIDMIFVVEGLHSKLLRQTILPNYKGGTAPSRPPEAYVEFTKLREALVSTFTRLGTTAVCQDTVDGDDVVAYLCHNLKGEKIIDSGDGDMAVLISDGSTETEGVTLIRQGVTWKDNPIGPFPCKYITVYKALVGDTSDKIPGAKGFGKEAWMSLMIAFGYDGLELMHDLIVKKQLGRLVEDVAECKPLQKILDDQAGVYASFGAARMYPEKVNTMRNPLRFTPGMVMPVDTDTDARLKHWAGKVRLVHTGNYDEALKFFRQTLAASPFVSFDIETSVTDEGEDWLRAIAKKVDEEDDDKLGIDVFGAKLAGFATTFGRNNQFTFYWTVDHLEEGNTKNLSIAQAKAVLESVPASKRTVIQNVAFELPVVMENLGPLEVMEDIPA